MSKKKFEVTFKTGEVETMHGDTISEAFALAGYSGGATAAIDSWKEIVPEIQEEEEGDPYECIECKETFYMTEKHVKWYIDRGWTPPKRCKTCRNKRKTSVEGKQHENK